MIFYFAGPYPQRENIAAMAEEFTMLTVHNVNSTWLLKSEESPLLYGEYAATALNDVEEADAIVVFTDYAAGSKGGMWVEMGSAMDMGKLVYIVGNEHYSNIFCHLADQHYSTFYDFVGAADAKD